MPVVLPQRLPSLLLFGAAVLCATGAQAHISVGLFGSAANPFTNTPPASEWATLDITMGGSSTYTSPAALDAWAQTFDQSTIITALPTTTANGTSRLARHNTVGTCLVTQPAGVPAVVLKATLRNTSGTTLHSVTVSYDYSIRVTPVTDECPGQRVFYSLTGASNSWMLITNFSGITNAGLLSATLSPEFWAHNTDLFILWLDDNNQTGQDGAFAIDNFSVSDVVPSDPTPITITNSPQSVAVAERGPVTFTVGAEGAPRKYYWFSNDVPVAGNNQASFTIPSVAYPQNDNAEIHVVVSNALMVVTSTPAILTVVPDTTPPSVVSVIGELDLTQVTVTFSEPIDPSTNEGSFAVFPTGSDPTVESLLTTGVSFADSNITVVISTEPRTAGVNYSLRVLQVVDASSQHNPIAPDPTIIPIRPTVQLIGLDTDNEWNYSLGGDLTGTGWESTGYDDSAWPSGAAPLGLDSSAGTGAQPAIRTTLPYTGQSEPIYFRRHFSFPALTNGAVLTLRHLAEDGAVYYLNGQEVFRTNVAPGPVTFATRAQTFAMEPTPVTGPFNLAITNLIPGYNVLAVVLIQAGAASFDAEFAAELIANVERFPTTPSLRISRNSGTGQITIRWSGAGTLQQANELPGSGPAWSDVPGNPNPYIFPPTTNTKRFFTLRP